LLRVIQERKFERIGGATPIEADVRIICATNRNLPEEVKGGRFREDLFFRVNVFPITVPPLRARREDIDGLTDFFITKFARELNKPKLAIAPAARAALREYSWPGNIRELENCIERAAILCDRNTIDVKDLTLTPDTSSDLLRSALDLTGTLAGAVERATRAVERAKVVDALRNHPSRAEAAEALGISARTLQAKLKELGIDEHEREDSNV
jgi:DNA-binding NtrC family response regulator